MKTIKMIDMTLRESASAKESSLSFKEKLEMARCLDRLKVDIIELAPITDGKADLVFTDQSAGQGRISRHAACGAVHDIRVLVDTSVLEIFLNRGETVFGTRYYAPEGPLAITWTGECSSAVAYPMQPITINYLVER